LSTPLSLTALFAGLHLRLELGHARAMPHILPHTLYGLPPPLPRLLLHLHVVLVLITPGYAIVRHK
jgi:hypothetical protein